MAKIKNFENKLIFIIGVTFPLIALRIDLKIYSISAFMISLMFLIVYSLFHKNNDIKYYFNKLDCIILIFSLWLIVSLLYSVNQNYGIIRIIKFNISILFYFFLKQIFFKNIGWPKKIINYSIISLFIYIMILSYFYFIKFHMSYLGVKIFYPTRLGKNSLALVFVLLLPFIISNLFDKKKNVNIINLSINIILLIAVFLIQSRALIIILFFYIIMFFFFTNKKSRMIWVLLLIGVIMLFFSKNLFDSNLVNSVVDRIKSISLLLAKNDLEGSLLERSNMINRALYLFEQKPILGVGLGSFMYYGDVKTLISHNDYLLILAEQGIIGIVIFILLLFSFFKKAVLKLKRTNDEFYICLIMTMIGLFIYFMFINAYDSILIWFIFSIINADTE